MVDTYDFWILIGALVGAFIIGAVIVIIEIKFGVRKW